MSTRQRGTRSELRRNAPGGRINRALLSGVLAAIVALGLASSASAASFEVNSNADTDDAACTVAPDGCTLREALNAALEAASAGPDQITFAGSLAGSTITVTGTELPTIDGPLTLTGLGADQLTISGGGALGILTINTAAGVDVAVSGLTLTLGNRVQGGAILTGGADLTVSDSAITGNDAEAGAGIYAHSFGGNAGALTIERNEISFNDAASTTTGAGGAGFLAVNTGPVLVRNSTISMNTAASTGAAGGQALGGGVEVEGTTPSATFESSTIAGNTLSHATNNANGGGINAPFLASDPVLRNTIVADNTVSGGVGTSGPDLNGQFDAAFTLVGDQTDATINETVAGSNILDQDPLLQALGANGGPTLTQALGPNSPALDAGRSFGAITDQRGTGFARPSDLAAIANSTAAGADGADIGAYELQGPPPPPIGNPQPPNDFTFGKLKRNRKKGIAFLFVDLPGPGEVGLAGKGVKTIGLAGASAGKSLAVAGGRVKLKIAPAKKGKRGKRLRARLLDKGKAKAKVRVTYVPTGGVANTRSKKVKLVRK